MALDLHVWNGGDNSDGLSWATAFQSILNPTVLAASAGTVVGVASDHVETATATSQGVNFSGGSLTNPVRVLSANRTTSQFELPAAPQLDGTTGSSYDFLGRAKITGLWIRHGYYANIGATDDFVHLRRCKFTVTRTSGALFNVLGPANVYQGCTVWLDDTEVDYTARTAAPTLCQTIRGGSQIRIRNMSFQHAAAGMAYGFICNYSGSYGNISRLDAENVDLSRCSNNILHSQGCLASLRGCSLPANWTLQNPAGPHTQTRLINCGSASPHTLPALGATEKRTLAGSIKATVAVYRTGGADDGEQSTPYSWQMISNANAVPSWVALESEPMAVWLDPDAAISGATPHYQSINTQAPPETTGTELATGSGWNGAGWSLQYQVPITAGDRTVTLHLASDVSLTDADFWVQLDHPDQVGGPAIVRAFLAKPNANIWVDPRLVVT